MQINQPGIRRPEANWCLLITLQHNMFPQTVSICHLNTNTCWFQTKRAVVKEITNSWLTYVRLSQCQSVFISLCLSHILHLSTDLQTASAVNLNRLIPVSNCAETSVLILNFLLSMTDRHTHTHTLFDLSPVSDPRLWLMKDKHE